MVLQTSSSRRFYSSLYKPSFLIPSILILITIFLFTNSHSQSTPSLRSSSPTDQGHCVDATRLDRSSNYQINRILSKLLPQSTFLSIFSVALDKQCPFWDDDGLCVIRECSVDNCEENEVPTAWREEEPDKVKECAPPKSDTLNAVDRSLPGLAALIGPPVYQVADSDAWTVRDDESERHYVDLRRNTEQFTGYTGQSSYRVWTAIYDENCFTFSDKCRSGICDASTCKEERVLYRLISGLHTSISMHIAKSFLKSTGWGVNTKIYKDRIKSFPERIENLHLAYAVVLRAVAKASNWLHPDRYNYITGNEENDVITKNGITNLLAVPVLQSGCEEKVFDESDMFLQNNKHLLPEFRNAFRNISMIMDCVGCEKCRLWGKLQFLGLGTALRILFENETPELERNDIIALFNLMYKLSTSVDWLDRMEDELNREARIKAKGGALVAVFVVIIVALLVRTNQQDQSDNIQPQSKQKELPKKKSSATETKKVDTVKDDESIAPSETDSAWNTNSTRQSERVRQRRVSDSS